MTSYKRTRILTVLMLSFKMSEASKSCSRNRSISTFLDLFYELIVLQLIEAESSLQDSSKAAQVHSQTLVLRLKQTQPAAEDAAPHLVDHVEHTSKKLWKRIRDAYTSDFEVTLERLKWPGKNLYLDEALEQEWASGVEKLLELQEPELKARESQIDSLSKTENPIALLPLEVMTKALELRFKYHFSGDKPTNRLDKVGEIALYHHFRKLTTEA